jgi:phosphate-selective porin
MSGYFFEGVNRRFKVDSTTIMANQYDAKPFRVTQIEESIDSRGEYDVVLTGPIQTKMAKDHQTNLGKNTASRNPYGSGQILLGDIPDEIQSMLVGSAVLRRIFEGRL